MRGIIFDLVVARSLNRGIGLNKKLPWSIPGDLKMFKKITCSGTNINSVIMGRKTYESIGKILPNRFNIVISKNTKINENQYLKQATSLEDALVLSHTFYPHSNKFVIGGAQIFSECLSNCRYIYETTIWKEL
jgi:dihydrofolate reductase